ncbi:LysR family transcriptional regulator [Flavobacterium sp. LaA7.5]|nr:LysR family transcriptional regulator [Flavobacterium salilacus subsp. altitudinum]
MNYTLHQLQVFLKVTQTKSITKAAEALYLTQPAVSIQLRNLQDQFDIPLTEVVGRQLYVTDFGEEIAKAAEAILNEVQAINYKTLAYKGQLSGRLKIASVSTGKYVMPYFLSGFLKEHPGIELSLDVTNKSKVVAGLEENLVDFALVSVLPAGMEVKKATLMQNRLYLVGNEKPEKKNYTKDFMGEVPLIYREKGSATRMAMENFVDGSSLTITRRIELTSNEAVKQAVIAGLGFSVMPLIGIKNELHNGDLHIYPLKALPIKTTWNLVWLKSKKFSPAAEAYLDYLDKEKEDIIKKHFSWFENY